MYHFSQQSEEDVNVNGGEGTNNGIVLPTHPLELKCEPNIDTAPMADVTKSGTPLPVVTSPTTSETASLPGDTAAGNGDGILCLKWNGFQDHLLESLSSILNSEELSDVTLVADTGELIKAHKIILALSSPYFRKVFQENPCKHSIVVLQGIKYEEVQQVMHFIYTGQVRVREKEFDDFMEAAESLRIDGINANPSNFSEGPGDDSPRSGTEDSPALSNPVPWSFPFTSSGQSQLLSPGDLGTTMMGGPRDSALLRKRSSASSGISTGTGGPSASCSPPLNLQRPAQPVPNDNRSLKKMLETDADPPRPPVLIEIDDEAQSRWNFSPGPWSKTFPLLNSSPHRGLHPEVTEVPAPTNSKRISMAEDLRKGNNSRSPETSYELTDAASFRTKTGLLITTPPILTPTLRNERRSTSWPLETSSSRSSQVVSSPGITLPNFLSHMTSPKASHGPLSMMSPGQRYFPFLPSSGSLPRPIPYHPIYFPPATVTQIANLPAFSFPQQRRGSIQEMNPGIGHHQVGCPYKRTTTTDGSPLLSKVPRSPSTGELGQGQRCPTFGRYETGIVTNPVRFTKPKTKAIRSSQVPQSARYTASQVDAMVEKVENFPGPLVPCVVCQKFVKRERLRAHIHECHLLPRERIECPICKIGLKSKGSYRVHLWRHRRSKFGTELKPTSSGKTDGGGMTREGHRQSSSSSWPPRGASLRSPMSTPPETSSPVIIHHSPK